MTCSSRQKSANSTRRRCHVPRDLPVQPRRFRPRSPFLSSDWSSGFPSYRTSKSSLVLLLFLGHSGFPPGAPFAVLLRLLHDRTPVCRLVSDYSYVLTRSSTSLPYIKAHAVPTVPQFEYLVAPRCTLYLFAQLFCPSCSDLPILHRSSISALSEIQRQ